MGLDMARGCLANTVIPCLRHLASPPMVDARLAREVGRPSRLALHWPRPPAKQLWRQNPTDPSPVANPLPLALTLSISP